MTGTSRPAAQAPDDLDPVDPGEPEVEDHEIGMVTRRERQRDLARRGEVDLVAPRLEVGPECPEQLGLVVDDEDAASLRGPQPEDHRQPAARACPRSRARRPSPRRTPARPRARARHPSPLPVESPSRWNGRNTARVRPAGARARGRRPARRRVRRPPRPRPGPGRLRGEQARAFGDEVGERALEQRRDRRATRRRVSGTSTSTSAAAAPRLASAAGTTSSTPTGAQLDVERRRPGAGSCRAGCRRGR